MGRASTHARLRALGAVPRHKLAPRVINAVAPTRICDIGGWTDTWFAKHGCVLNIAISPYIRVQVAPALPGLDGDLGRPALSVDASPAELARAATELMGLSREGLTISFDSEMPLGSSTGTSAAACVALIGALDALQGGFAGRRDIARRAHLVETQILGRQSGIQDQLAAAFGGISLIEIRNYPRAVVRRMRLPKTLRWELEARLSLVYLGKAHDSSAAHESVIRELSRASGESRALAALRGAAYTAHDALRARDLPAFGRAMIANTEAQRELDPSLVSLRHQQVIDVARDTGALGWKVNGAGGDGGSVTVLHGLEFSGRHELRHFIESDAQFRLIPISLDNNGLRVWETRSSGADTQEREGASLKQDLL